jgi:pimeloyl-ACP methyl ester carboxylesterase
MAQPPDLYDFQASNPGIGNRLPVIFVHGFAGNRQNWDDFQGKPEEPLPQPGVPQLAGEHWHPPLLPLAGYRVRLPAQPPARGLYPLLAAEGHPVVSWTQADSVGPIEDTVDELELVVAFAKEQYNAERVILVAHSRGGLVCRGYLRRHREAPDVAALVTLGTPHQGTRVATLDDRALNLITDEVGQLLPSPAGELVARAAANVVRELWLSRIASLKELERWGAPSDYIRQLIPDSQLDSVRYIAVAGFQPVMSSAAIEVYDAMSFVPQGIEQPWHWSWTVPRVINLPKDITELHLAQFQEFREWYDGGGDGFVAVDSAQLHTTPGSTNVVNLKYDASHTLLLRVTEVQQRVIEELRTIG